MDIKVRLNEDDMEEQKSNSSIELSLLPVNNQSVENIWVGQYDRRKKPRTNSSSVSINVPLNS